METDQARVYFTLLRSQKCIKIMTRVGFQNCTFEVMYLVTFKKKNYTLWFVKLSDSSLRILIMVL